MPSRRAEAGDGRPRACQASVGLAGARGDGRPPLVDEIVEKFRKVVEEERWGARYGDSNWLNMQLESLSADAICHVISQSFDNWRVWMLATIYIKPLYDLGRACIS